MYILFILIAIIIINIAVHEHMQITSIFPNAHANQFNMRKNTCK